MEISLKFVHAGPTENRIALVPAMAWSQTGIMPLPELMFLQELQPHH